LEKQLDLLEKIQEIDLSLKYAREFLEDLPRLKEEIEDQCRTEEEKLADEKAHLDEARKERKRKEHELEDGEEHLKKSHGRLNAVKTNKEYDAMLLEIENQKQRNSQLEEDILLLYDQLDELERRTKEMETGLKSFMQEQEEKKRELEEKRKVTAENISRLEDEREGVNRLIEPEIIATYERIRQRLGDPALARAVDEVCTSCYRRIPPQMYNEVLKGDRVHTCPNCQRILVYREAEFLAAKEA